MNDAFNYQMDRDTADAIVDEYFRTVAFLQNGGDAIQYAQADARLELLLDYIDEALEISEEAYLDDLNAWRYSAAVASAEAVAEADAEADEAFAQAVRDGHVLVRAAHLQPKARPFAFLYDGRLIGLRIALGLAVLAAVAAPHIF